MCDCAILGISEASGRLLRLDCGSRIAAMAEINCISVFSTLAFVGLTNDKGRYRNIARHVPEPDFWTAAPAVRPGP